MVQYCNSTLFLYPRISGCYPYLIKSACLDSPYLPEVGFKIFFVNETLLMLEPFFACLKVFFIFHKSNGYLAGFKNLDWELFFFFSAIG